VDPLAADDLGVPDHPNVPRRAAVILAYLGVLVAGGLGTLIGWGLVDTGCEGSCAGPLAIGAVVGGALAALGAAVVAVLVLRAMSEWRAHPPPSRPGGGPASGEPRASGEPPASGAAGTGGGTRSPFSAPPGPADPGGDPRRDACS
jgi:hypothetical protein